MDCYRNGSSEMIVPKPHRFAITGPSSAGKTTLAEALMRNRRFSCLVDTMIPEGTRTLLRNQGHTSFDAMTRKELRDFQRGYFLWKQEAESKADNYLVDRSFVDVAAIWVERDTFDQSLDVQNELVIPCRDLAKRYTLHFYLPSPVFGFDHDGVRESDLSLHGRIAMRVRQYLDDWELQYVSLRSSTLDLRICEVCAELERSGLITPQA